MPVLLRRPDLDLFLFAAPFQRLAVGGEIEVDVHALDGAADILDAPPSIVGDKHDGAEGIVAGVGGDGAPVGLRSGRGDADRLGCALVGAVGNDRLEFPVFLPPAALAAFAVSGGFHADHLRLLVARQAVAFSAPRHAST